METLKIDDRIFWALSSDDGQGGYRETYTLDSRPSAQKDVGITAWLATPLHGLLGFPHVLQLVLPLLLFPSCPLPTL